MRHLLKLDAKWRAIVAAPRWSSTESRRPRQMARTDSVVLGSRLIVRSRPRSFAHSR
jgi:hypothetical protein